MQGLPVELQEEILLSLKEPEDLYRACSSSRQNRAICSSDAFWREKFRRENLPLLNLEDFGPTGFVSWLNLYNKSLLAASVADERIGNMFELRTNLLKEPIKVEGLHIRDLWKRTGVEREYIIRFIPQEDFYLVDVLVELRKVLPLETRVVVNRVDKRKVLSSKDVWFVIYQMALLDYPF